MFTFAVINCNRLYYLQNCIKSILAFIDLELVDLLVIDNGSTEPGTDEYLNSISDQAEIYRYTDRTPNELHRAMNFAIEYSRGKGNKYINFIQEDYQYLFKEPNLFQWIIDAFNQKKEVVQLQTNMIWDYKKNTSGKFESIEINGAKWFYMHENPPCDNGITRVSLYDTIGLYPEKVSIHGKEYRSGESWLRQECKKYGYKKMMLGKANMGMLIDSAFVRENERIGKYFEAPGEYYLKPFDKDAMNILNTLMINNERAFIEKLVTPDGWVPNKWVKRSERKDIVTQL